MKRKLQKDEISWRALRKLERESEESNVWRKGGSMNNVWIKTWTTNESERRSLEVFKRKYRISL